MTIRIDASEVREFASDLLRGLDRVPSEARQVVSKGALNIKNDLAGEARRSRHFKIAPTIGYDMKGNASFTEAEIGPALGGAGSLAHIAYFGGANGGGGTLPDPQGALDRETPNIERYLADVVADLF